MSFAVDKRAWKATEDSVENRPCPRGSGPSTADCEKWEHHFHIEDDSSASPKTDNRRADAFPNVPDASARRADGFGRAIFYLKENDRVGSKRISPLTSTH